MTNRSDVIVIGGGIVGLATAWQLSQLRPDIRVNVLEKEAAVAQHQSGNNSGVLHSGIYYKPGSLKAINCRAGHARMQAFCQQHEIDFEICGKVIVASNEAELPALDNIFQRGLANGVRCEKIAPERLAELEPHVRGVAAIHVRETGIVDYVQVCRTLERLLNESGNRVITSTCVEEFDHRRVESVVKTNQGEYSASLIINCTGLHSDRVTKLAGDRPAAKIVPFRGEYYVLKPERRSLCRNLIYPVPDPAYPFLGVHFTRMTNGDVECGPNAVLAFAREGYHFSNVSARDLWETLSFRGFQKMARKHWRMGANEIWRSLSKSAFVRALQKLIPEIRADDLEVAPAGIRAQAISPSGELVEDFLIVESDRMIHVNNAPSPAATASLAIGQTIAGKVLGRL